MTYAWLFGEKMFLGQQVALNAAAVWCKKKRGIDNVHAIGNLCRTSARQLAANFFNALY